MAYEEKNAKNWRYLKTSTQEMKSYYFASRNTVRLISMKLCSHVFWTVNITKESRPTQSITRSSQDLETNNRCKSLCQADLWIKNTSWRISWVLVDIRRLWVTIRVWDIMKIIKRALTSSWEVLINLVWRLVLNHSTTKRIWRLWRVNQT